MNLWLLSNVRAKGLVTGREWLMYGMCVSSRRRETTPWSTTCTKPWGELKGTKIDNTIVIMYNAETRVSARHSTTMLTWLSKHSHSPQNVFPNSKTIGRQLRYYQPPLHCNQRFSQYSNLTLLPETSPGIYHPYQVVSYFTTTTTTNTFAVTIAYTFSCYLCHSISFKLSTLHQTQVDVRT